MTQQAQQPAANAPTSSTPPEADATTVVAEPIDKEELLKSLGLEEMPENLEGDEERINTEVEKGRRKGRRKKEPPPAPTALDLDRWCIRQGRELLEKWRGEEEMRPLVPRVGESEKEKDTNDEATANLLADLHAAAFEPEVRLNEKCVNPLQHQFVKQLLETPEYHALHEQTMFQDLASEIATSHYRKQYMVLEEERKKNPQKANDPNGLNTDVMKAVSSAVRDAQQDVDAQQEVGRALGVEQGQMDPKKIAQLQKKIRGNPAVKRICELTGKYRRLAQSRQRQRVIHGQDDVVGVTLDNDVGKLLPSELVKLADPDFELEFMRKFCERRLTCLEMKGTEQVAKGPIIIYVDESGSMTGEPVYTAKAIAVAMAWIARYQKRWCALVAFSCAGNRRAITLPPGKWDEEKLIDWLAGFFGGGTEPELEKLQEVYDMTGAPVGTTDVLIVTDGAIVLNDPNAVLTWKAKSHAKLRGLVVGCQQLEPLASVCDEIYSVPNLGVEQEAVGKVLGV